MNDLENTEKIPVLDEKKTSKKKPKRRPKVGWNIFLTVLAVVVNILFIVEVFYVTKYSALSTGVFMIINAVMLAVLLILDGLVFFSIRLRNLTLVLIASCLLITGAGAGSYAAYVLLRVDKSVNDITNSSYTKTVNTALVVYEKGTGKEVRELADISGALVGIASGTGPAEVAETYLAEAGVVPEYKSYNDYASVFNALISSEIDVAVLPGSYKSVLNTDEAIASYFEDTSVIESFTADVKAESVVSADKDLTKAPFTVLLTGENEGLADTIMIVTVNPISMRVTMTSIARDSYVPIACYYGGKSKINAAHTVSEECMVDTVEQLTGVEIYYTVEFNFDSVIEVVDAVGGIDIYNEVEFNGLTWDIATQAEYFVPMPAGELHLDGIHALAYARERYAFEDGDFARQRHQQEIIQKVLAKIMASRNPNMYLDVLSAAGNNIKTNISAEQMVTFMSYAMKKASRYYDSSNVASVFNIRTNRITGYSAMQWNEGLSMYLYIYLLYNGAISDSYNSIQRNIDMNQTPSLLGSVSWSAHDTYTPPALSQDEYYEHRETMIGGPEDSASQQETQPEVIEPVEETPSIDSEPIEETPVVPEEQPIEPDPGDTDLGGDQTGEVSQTPEIVE